MKLYKLVIKDVIRRKRRVLYAALGIVIGTMTVVGILTIALAGQQKVYNQLEKYGPNLTVIPAINNLDMKVGDLSMGTVTVGENYIPEDKLPAIRTIADNEIRQTLNITDEGNIATLAPKLFTNTRLNDTSIMVVGIDPEEEIKVKTWWRIDKGDTEKNMAMEMENAGTPIDLNLEDDDVIVGSTAAELLKLNAGEVITFGTSDFKIAGILEATGANDDYQIFMPLKSAQKTFGKDGKISSLDIRALCNSCPVEQIADEVNKSVLGVRAVAVKQVAATEMGMVDKMNRLMMALAGITLAIGLFGVINTMQSSVHERLKDIGIMRAVGASRNQIIRVFIYEAVIIGILGGVFGYIAGTLLALLIGPLIFEGASISLVPVYFGLALAVAIVVSVIAAIYPAYSASRIKVADSFRSL